MCAIAMEQELTLAEAAASLGVSVQTVMRRIKAGRIKARQEGQEWRIRESDLKQYINSGYEQRHGEKPGDKPPDTEPVNIVRLDILSEERG